MTLETGPGPVGLLVYVRPLELVIKLQAGSRRVGFELIFSRYRAVRVTGSVEKGQVKLGCIVCYPNRQEMKQYQYIGTCTHAQLNLRVKDKRQPHEVTGIFDLIFEREAGDGRGLRQFSSLFSSTWRAARGVLFSCFPSTYVSPVIYQ